MKPESLQALIIDRHLGELSPEAEELLELHLAQDATARAAAERVLETMDITRRTVMQHPELARVAPMVAHASRSRRPIFAVAVPWLARAAALTLLAAAAGAGGFMMGRSRTTAVVMAANPPPALSMVAPSAPAKSSPWAQYRVSYDAAGEGMQVVRVDTANLEREANR